MSIDRRIVILGAIGLQMTYDNDEIGLDVGGDGYDIALAFSAIPEPCVFGSAVHQGAFADFLETDADENNIRLIYDKNPDMKFAGSIRISDGEYNGKYSVAPVFESGIREDVIDRCMEKIRALIVEAAFREDIFRMIMGKMHGRKAPAFIVVRTIADFDKVSGVDVGVPIKIVSFLPDEALIEIKSRKAVEIINFSPSGVVSVLDNGYIIKSYDLEKTIRESMFVFMAAMVIHQSLSWNRTLAKSFSDCQMLIRNRLSVDRTEVSSDSIDRKFARFSRKVENLEHDFLTGLKTRGTTDQKIGELLGTNSSFSIFLIDIDHFKSVNDTWGHDVGDSVLAAVAREITKGVRSSDITGRWGGEEFIVIMPGADINVAWSTAERIRRKIMEMEGMPRTITASFGLAEYKHGEEFSETVSRSDKGLYKAKRNGRNQVVLYLPGDEIEEDTAIESKEESK